MTQRQQTILKQITRWAANNATVLVGVAALSWQISSKMGPWAYYKVANTLDTINVTRLVSRQTAKDLSEFKVDQRIRDNQQDTVVLHLMANLNTQR